MAKVKYGAIVTDMSGKLGGHVFSKNKGGSYMRTKVTPLNPQTVAQTGIRGLFSAISQNWSALTEAQRNSFRDSVEQYARTNVFGDIKNPTGKALYQRLNQNLGISGQALIEICGAPQEVPFADMQSVTGAEGVQALSATLSGNTTGSKLVFFATPSLSAGTKFVKNKLRKIGVVNGGVAGATDILALYTAKFGAVVENDNVYVGVKVINANGQASPLEVVKATIGA